MSFFGYSRWKNIPIHSFFKVQLRLVRAISLGSIRIHLNVATNTLLKLDSPKSFFLTLKKAQIAHTVVYSLKGMFIFKSAFLDGLQLNGNALVRISFWIVPSSIGYLVISFARYKEEEFVKICNTLFTNKTIQESATLRILFLNTPALSIGMSVLYALLVVFTTIDPITAVLKPYLVNWPTAYIALKLLLSIYDAWNFALMATLGCFIVYDGMFPGYVALGQLTEKLFTKIRTPSNWATAIESVNHYHKLELYTKLTNDCFQDGLALPLKFTLMLFAVLLGSVVLDTKLQNTTSTEAFILCLYTLVNLYVLMAIGYSFPGMANQFSLKTLHKLRNILADKGAGGKISRRAKIQFRKEIKACRDVRIGFGMVNYYERLTVIHILKVIIEATVNIVLMV